MDIWPDNIAVWKLWRQIERQWRIVAGFGGVMFQGLDLQGVEAAMNMSGIKKRDRPALFEALRIMESAALEILNQTD